LLIRPKPWLFLAALLWAALPAAGLAQEPAETVDRDEEARGLFQAGRAAYERGRFGDALNYFQQAFELSGRPQLLYNVAQAADKLRLDETALAAFSRYLDETPDALNREQVEQRIRMLEEVISRRSPEPATPPEDEPTPEHINLEVGLEPTVADQAEDSKPITEQWWFWGTVGVVVLAIVVGVVVASSGGEEAGTLTRGSDGVVIAVLWSE